MSSNSEFVDYYIKCFVEDVLSISGKQQPDEVPEYDFKFILPPTERRWPFLEIRD